MNGKNCKSTNKNAEDAIHVTPRKMNIEPGNDGLEDDFPKFQGCILRFHVSLPGCILQKKKPFENSTCTESTNYIVGGF